MHAHRLLPLAAALCGALALPAAAHAADPPVAATYDAEFEGVYHYDATESAPGAMDATRTTEVAWRSVARGLRLTRLPADETAVRETEAPTATASGTYHESIHSDPPVVQDCRLSLAAAPPRGIVGARSEPDRQVGIEFEPFARVDLTKACTYPTPVPEETLLGSNMTGRATFSRDRVGDLQIVLPVESAASLPCPSYELTTRCEATWTGRITLTRTELEEAPRPAPRPPATSVPPIVPSDVPPLVPPSGQVDPADVPPLVPPSQQIDPADVPPLVPAEPSMEDLLAPLVPAAQAVRIDRRGTLRFRARCARGCTGSVTVRPAGPRAATAAATAAASGGGRVRLRVAAGATRVVAVRLPTATRRALQGRRAAAVTLALTDAATKRTTRTRLVARVA